MPPQRAVEAIFRFKHFKGLDPARVSGLGVASVEKSIYIMVQLHTYLFEYFAWNEELLKRYG